MNVMFDSVVLQIQNYGTTYLICSQCLFCYLLGPVYHVQKTVFNDSTKNGLLDFSDKYSNISANLLTLCHWYSNTSTVIA